VLRRHGPSCGGCGDWLKPAEEAMPGKISRTIQKTIRCGRGFGVIVRGSFISGAGAPAFGCVPEQNTIRVRSAEGYG